jgi:hypothetical protein
MCVGGQGHAPAALPPGKDLVPNAIKEVDTNELNYV